MLLNFDWRYNNADTWFLMVKVAVPQGRLNDPCSAAPRERQQRISERRGSPTYLPAQNRS